MSYISVVIFIKDHASNLITTISSVKNIAAEIIIVSDDIIHHDIAVIKDKYEIELVFGKWQTQQQQRALAQKLSQNNWLLILEANEELSSELLDEIEYIFADKQQDRYSAYSIKFKPLVRDKIQSGFLAPINKLLRLYDKTTISKNIHNLYELNGIAYQRFKKYDSSFVLSI